jgi:hypothetical protein
VTASPALRVPTAYNPLATHNKPTNVRDGNRVHQTQVNNTETVVQFPANNQVIADLRCPAIAHKRINNLIWAAFPGRSAHAVSQRASRVMGRDPRTIRSWMSGETTPSWTEVGIIAGYATVDRGMQILFGAR